MIETFQYFCLFQKIFPISSHLFPIISFMVTVSPLKPALTVDPNEPRPSCSSLRFIIKEFGRQRILGKWYFLWRNKLNFESHNLRILRNYWQHLLKENKTVKNTLFEFWYERNDNLFFSHKNYLQKQPFADLLSRKLLLKLSQYSQENTWRLEDLQLY